MKRSELPQPINVTTVVLDKNRIGQRILGRTETVLNQNEPDLSETEEPVTYQESATLHK